MGDATDVEDINPFADNKYDIWEYARACLGKQYLSIELCTSLLSPPLWLCRTTRCADDDDKSSSFVFQEVGLW